MRKCQGLDSSVLQLPLPATSRFRIHKRNLLETPGGSLIPEPFWLVWRKKPSTAIQG